MVETRIADAYIVRNDEAEQDHTSKTNHVLHTDFSAETISCNVRIVKDYSQCYITCLEIHNTLNLLRHED